jgi:hypothetical protein
VGRAEVDAMVDLVLSERHAMPMEDVLTVHRSIPN